MNIKSDNTVFGMIAGGTDLPIEFLKHAHEYGIKETVVVGFKEWTPEEVAKNATYYEEMKLGELSRLIKLFKKKGVTKAVMLGRVPPKLAVTDISLDFRLLSLASKILDRRADGIFKAVADELAKDGIYLQNTNEYLKHLLTPKGVITKKQPDKKQEIDIQFGIDIATAIGTHDIGQTAVVHKHAVIAVEAMEGTDECIKRAGKYTKNAVVVKLAKPNQDFRFDVPCVGPGTIESMIESGASVLAVEANRSFILSRDKTVDLANKNGIIICGIEKKAELNLVDQFLQTSSTPR